MRSEPVWLTADEIIQLDEVVIATSPIPDEPCNLLNREGLESAQAKPLNHWHYGEDDVATLAVELLLGIARNHPFEQGNKRTALLAAGLFMEYNGYVLTVVDTELFAEVIVAVLTGEIDQSGLIWLVRRHAAEIRNIVTELPRR